MLLFIYSIFFDKIENPYVVVVLLILCMAFGGTCGYFLVKALKHGVALLGAFAGFCIAFLVCNFVQVSDPRIFWGSAAGAALILGLLSY